MKHTFKTFLLMLGLTLLFLFIGQSIGGRQGLISAFLFAIVMNFITYWFSDKIVLMMYGGRQVSREQMPEVYALLEELTAEAKLPMPKVYLLPMEIPNAFATGRDPSHASVAVTKGTLELLDREELKGVLAHELSHIKNRDILIATIAATIAGAIMMLARMAQYATIFAGGNRDDREGGSNPLGLLLLTILAPLAAIIIQMAISRTREYQADQTGGKISRNPLSLARALEKLDSYTRKIPLVNANPTMAHLFIVNPLRGGGIFTLFSTHPPIKERIKRLEKLAQEMSGYKIPKIIY
jgi:heat shock protein HtpX